MHITKKQSVILAATIVVAAASFCLNRYYHWRNSQQRPHIVLNQQDFLCDIPYDVTRDSVMVVADTLGLVPIDSCATDTTSLFEAPDTSNVLGWADYVGVHYGLTTRTSDNIDFHATFRNQETAMKVYDKVRAVLTRKYQESILPLDSGIVAATRFFAPRTVLSAVVAPITSTPGSVTYQVAVVYAKR